MEKILILIFLLLSWTSPTLAFEYTVEEFDADLNRFVSQYYRIKLNILNSESNEIRKQALSDFDRLSNYVAAAQNNNKTIQLISYTESLKNLMRPQALTIINKMVRSFTSLSVLSTSEDKFAMYMFHIYSRYTNEAFTQEPLTLFNSFIDQYILSQNQISALESKAHFLSHVSSSFLVATIGVFATTLALNIKNSKFGLTTFKRSAATFKNHPFWRKYATNNQLRLPAPTNLGRPTAAHSAHTQIVVAGEFIARQSGTQNVSQLVNRYFQMNWKTISGVTAAATAWTLPKWFVGRKNNKAIEPFKDQKNATLKAVHAINILALTCQAAIASEASQRSLSAQTFIQQASLLIQLAHRHQLTAQISSAFSGENESTYRINSPEFGITKHKEHFSYSINHLGTAFEGRHISCPESVLQQNNISLFAAQRYLSQAITVFLQSLDSQLHLISKNMNNALLMAQALEKLGVREYNSILIILAKKYKEAYYRNDQALVRFLISLVAQIRSPDESSSPLNEIRLNPGVFFASDE